MAKSVRCDGYFTDCQLLFGLCGWQNHSFGLVNRLPIYFHPKVQLSGCLFFGFVLDTLGFDLLLFLLLHLMAIHHQLIRCYFFVFLKEARSLRPLNSFRQLFSFNLVVVFESFSSCVCNSLICVIELFDELFVFANEVLNLDLLILQTENVVVDYFTSFYELLRCISLFFDQVSDPVDSVHVLGCVHGAIQVAHVFSFQPVDVNVGVLDLQVFDLAVSIDFDVLISLRLALSSSCHSTFRLCKSWHHNRVRRHALQRNHLRVLFFCRKVAAHRATVVF